MRSISIPNISGHLIIKAMPLTFFARSVFNKEKETNTKMWKQGFAQNKPQTIGSVKLKQYNYIKIVYKRETIGERQFTIEWGRIVGGGRGGRG